MNKEISNQDFLRVAELAKLKYSDQDLSVAKKQLEFALEIISQLDEVDVENVEPTFLISHNLNLLREDSAEDWQQKTSLLKNAPESANDQIKVPAILNEDAN